MAFQRVEIKNPVGINKDLPPTELPPNVWTDGVNVLFNNGKSTKAQGHTKVFDPLTAAPYWAFPVITAGVAVWHYATATKIYRYFGQAHEDLTRTVGGDYAMDVDVGWNGGLLNGLPIANNGVDVPQIIEAADSAFKDMPNWDTNLRAKVIRPFKNYLIAMNLTDTGTELPHSIQWSSPADPGFAPPSWDNTDPTQDAGRVPLSDSIGRIIDGLALQDQFIIYKEDAIYSMRFVGGLPVFSFKKIFDDAGALSTNCAVEFQGQHFVVAIGDVYIHNGVSKKSIITQKMKDFLYSNISEEYAARTHVAIDRPRSEIWINFPNKNTSAGECNTALIWNYQEDTWSIRDIPNTYYTTAGVIDPDAVLSGDVWDNDNGAWNNAVNPWNDTSYNPTKQKMILVSATNTAMYIVDETSLFDTSSFTAILEKTGIDFEDRRGIKYLNSVHPHIVGNGTVDVFVGAQMWQDQGIEWKGPYTLTIGEDFKIDCRISGRLLAVKFVSDSESSWDLNGYSLEVDLVGED